MPWGVWNPQYVAAGVVKTKEHHDEAHGLANLDFRLFDLLYSKIAPALFVDGDDSHSKAPANYRAALKKKDDEIRRLKGELEAVYASRSWRLGRSLVRSGRTMARHLPLVGSRYRDP